MNVNRFLDSSQLYLDKPKSKLEHFQVTNKDKLKLTVVRCDSLGRESEYQFHLNDLTLEGTDVRNPNIITKFRVNLE